MRISPVVLLLACVFVCGHDAVAQDAAETILLNQQVMQGVVNVGRQPGPINLHAPPQAQQSPQTPQKTAQGETAPVYAVSDAPRPLPECGCTGQPSFSVQPGDLTPGTQVTIASPAQDAVVFYTTDGWTPTEASLRYAGPITINADTKLQAIAEEPGKLPSTIAEVDYTVNASPAPHPEKALAPGGVLLKGTPLRLVTGDEVTSETARVGDRIPLLLDENVIVGETIVAPKGSPVEATITRADRAGRDGKPGVLAFQVHSLNVHGILVPLSANLTLSAPDTAVQAQRLLSTSLVHVAGAQPPGDDAEIELGTALTASVSADTALHP